ncbi:Dor1-like protein [Penicillium expansum]|nr:Dor1-like protein [Penicillium expansum]
MADLLELLAPHLDPTQSHDVTTDKYLTRLSTLSLEALQTTEPPSLAQSSHSTLLSLQALSNRSHRAFVTSADNLSTLCTSVPQLTREAQQLRDAIPKLDEEAVGFSTKYSKITDNAALERRKKAMQLSRNVDRLSDILELPSLLSKAVSAASVNSGTGVSSTTYSSALDLHAHIKRLQTLYPESPLILDVASQAEDAMKDMTSNLITGLRTQNLRLAAGIRTVGWLRRVAPDLDMIQSDGVVGTGEGALGAIFLLWIPSRELADQETQRRLGGRDKSDTASWSGGQQTDRYLKRYIEIFREQSFAIVSLYKNIFNSEQSESEFAISGLRGADAHSKAKSKPAHSDDPLQRLPRLWLLSPCISFNCSRIQCAPIFPTLGRLGGDFGMILTELGEEEDTDDMAYEWEEVMRKHRALAGRLEQLTSRVPVN